MSGSPYYERRPTLLFRKKRVSRFFCTYTALFQFLFAYQGRIQQGVVQGRWFFPGQTITQ